MKRSGAATVGAIVAIQVATQQKLAADEPYILSSGNLSIPSPNDKIIWKEYETTQNVTITGAGTTKAAATRAFNNNCQTQGLSNVGKSKPTGEIEVGDVTGMTACDPPEIGTAPGIVSPPQLNPQTGNWEVTGIFPKGTKFRERYWK